jgi:hypothetical protein
MHLGTQAIDQNAQQLKIYISERRNEVHKKYLGDWVILKLKFTPTGGIRPNQMTQ